MTIYTRIRGCICRRDAGSAYSGNRGEWELISIKNVDFDVLPKCPTDFPHKIFINLLIRRLYNY